MLNGATSDPVNVKSGVPQGTVLGPLMVLVFINDIAERTQSQVRLFANDCLIYRPINDSNDSYIFQHDLDLLCQWARRGKCALMKPSDLETRRIELETRPHNPYLGVEIQDDLKLNKHIDQCTTKANRNLGFLRRNLSRCPESIKEQAYCALVRPT